MNRTLKTILTVSALALFASPTNSWAQGQDEDADKNSDQKKAESSQVQNVATVGVYYLDDDAYRYGKYSGLTDTGF